MSKKFWIGVVVVFVLWSLTNFIVHDVILGSAWKADQVMKVMRPDMQDKMWIFYVTTAIMSMFFTLIFSKGYEGKGVLEGVRFGLYTGFLLATPMAYDSYAMYPLPYPLILQWFLYGMVQYIILGMAVALVFGKKEVSAPSKQPAAV
jgi:hypothetical protein